MVLVFAVVGQQLNIESAEQADRELNRILKQLLIIQITWVEIGKSNDHQHVVQKLILSLPEQFVDRLARSGALKHVLRVVLQYLYGGGNPFAAGLLVVLILDLERETLFKGLGLHWALCLAVLVIVLLEVESFELKDGPVTVMLTLTLHSKVVDVILKFGYFKHSVREAFRWDLYLLFDRVRAGQSRLVTRSLVGPIQPFLEAANLLIIYHIGKAVVNHIVKQVVAKVSEHEMAVALYTLIDLDELICEPLIVFVVFK